MGRKAPARRLRQLGGVLLSSGLLGWALVAALLPACAPVVKGEAHGGAAARRAPIERVAVAPFTAGGSLARRPLESGETSPDVAAALVARHLAEGLAGRGVDVVAPEDVVRVLEARGQQLAPPAMARLVSQKFGADALVLGRVLRFVERAGEATGTLRPASVWFEVTLYTAPGAEKLWSATFDETQRALSEDIRNAARYPGRGTRWLTVEELIRWGARETARSIPLGR